MDKFKFDDLNAKRNKKLYGLIKGFLKENRISIRQFCVRCGISTTYINRIKEGQHPDSSKPMQLSINTLERIALGMEMSLEDLMRECGYFDNKD